MRAGTVELDGCSAAIAICCVGQYLKKISSEIFMCDMRQSFFFFFFFLTFILLFFPCLFYYFYFLIVRNDCN